jgi:hypothetical protein
MYFPGGLERIKSITMSMLFDRKENKSEKSAETNKKAITELLDKMGSQLTENYSDNLGMPEVILTSRVKLTPKTFQYLKIIQIKSIFDVLGETSESEMGTDVRSEDDYAAL